MATTQNKFISPQTPFSYTAVATAAEVAFNAPSTTVQLIDRSLNINGARLTRLYAITRAVIAAVNNCQIYEYNGTTKTLIESALLGVVSPSATVANGKIDYGYNDAAPFFLRAGYGLEVAIGTAIANGVVFKVEGGFY